MATKNIEIQDSDGNIYHPHTNASVVKNGSTTVAEQLKEIANKVDNIKIADGTTTQKGIVQLNNTTNSTSITQAATANAVRLAMERANSAFQSASDGKNAIAGKVGNVTGNSTHTEIANRIQTDKNTAASNLNSKGVSASLNEALASLVGKIANISVEGMGGMQVTTGSTNLDGTGTKKFMKLRDDFTTTGTKADVHYVTITLDFTPTYGFVYFRTSSSDRFCVSTLIKSNVAWTGHGVYEPIISGNTIIMPVYEENSLSAVTYVFLK
ncbi:tail fiber protein [Clostridium sp. VAP41]|uniref:phage tail protein n=1 Tax=Clostridium sp. VAP41 TaxID=2949979 RepID=UPI00207932F3|nr:tail fiber protein [Clostridium sp. VAP41]